MPYVGWLQVAGNEIVNSSRAAALSGVVRCVCPDLQASLGDGGAPYSDVTTAPWYDLGAPESAEFSGVAGLEFTGASDGTIERQWTELIGDGGVGGAARRASREVEFKVLALATTEHGLSWGMTWLASVLRGSNCLAGCAGDDLCMYAACPVVPPGSPDPITDPDGYRRMARLVGDELVRQMFDVALVDGPAVENRYRLGGGLWAAEVAFTLKAGTPFWWRAPVTAFDSTSGQIPYSDQIPDYDIMASAYCPEPPDCMAGSPYCTGENSPWGDEPFPGSDPQNPGQFLDPCYPTAPFLARRLIFTIPRDLTPGWTEKVPVVAVFSGSRPLHRVTVRWYTNPQDRPPGPDLDPCTACTEITIPWIPVETELTLDGRLRRALVDCKGAGDTESSVTLYGPRGDLFDWPEFDCATPLYCEIIALATSLANDLWFRIDMVPREDAC